MPPVVWRCFTTKRPSSYPADNAVQSAGRQIKRARSEVSSAAAKPPAMPRWSSLPDLRSLAHETTIFDDGRYLAAAVERASLGGWLSRDSQGVTVPPELRRSLSMALGAPLVESELCGGFDGGGGVRLKPLHLNLSSDESQAALRALFTSSDAWPPGGSSSCM